MSLIRFFVVLFLVLVSVTTLAQAKVKYFDDPVYENFNPEDRSPMGEMVDLAKNGDVRAQYILGDLYSKGKSGVKKDRKEAFRWFEMSAKNGYMQSFVRLAALAKHRKKPKEAYKWYTLALKGNIDPGWRKHAQTSRDKLVVDEKMTREDIDAAHKAANLWRAKSLKEKREREKNERIKRVEDAKKASEDRKKSGMVEKTEKPEVEIPQ